MLGPSLVQPIYLAGSFGLLVRPAWSVHVIHALTPSREPRGITTAVRSQDVEGLTRPPRSPLGARFAYPVHECTLLVWFCYIVHGL